MSEEKRLTARFEIEFSKLGRIRAFFGRLSRVRNIAYSLLRGRVTGVNAKYEIEFSSGSRNVEKVLRRCARRGVLVRSFDVLA